MSHFFYLMSQCIYRIRELLVLTVDLFIEIFELLVIVIGTICGRHPRGTEVV